MSHQIQRFALLLSIAFILGSLSYGAVGRAQDSTEPITLVQYDHHISQSPAWEEAIAIFEAENPNINIDRQVSANSLDEIELALSFGQSTLDIVVWRGTESLRTIMQLGDVLYPLENFDDYDAFVADFPDFGGAPMFANNLNVFNGQVVSLPFERSLPLWHLFINTRLYREAGLVDDEGDLLLPTTIAEVFEHSLHIYETLGVWGFSTDRESYINIFDFCRFSLNAMNAFVFGYDPHVGEFRASQEPCYDELFQGYQRLLATGAVPPDQLETSFDVLRQRFVDGQVAHMLDGVWNIRSLEDIDPNFQDYVMIQPPLRTGLDAPSSFEGRFSIGDLMFMSITANTAHPDAAWEWFKFIHSPRFADIWLENENGISLFLESDPAEFDLSESFQNYISQSHLIRQTTDIDTPAIQVGFEIIGDNEFDILYGILNGEIEDYQAALANYDQRAQDAFDLMIEENAALGIDISQDDFISLEYQWLPPVPLFQSSN